MFQLSIETDNDAMQDEFALADAIDHVAERVRRGNTEGGVVDVNGNTVGSFTLS